MVAGNEEGLQFLEQNKDDFQIRKTKRLPVRLDLSTNSGPRFYFHFEGDPTPPPPAPVKKNENLLVDFQDVRGFSF